MNKFTLFIVSGKNPPCRTSTRWIEIVFEIDLAFLAGADFLQNVAESERIYRFLCCQLAYANPGTGKFSLPVPVKSTGVQFVLVLPQDEKS